jgi:uncharacterized protein YjbI with pentapeptide repeats
MTQSQEDTSLWERLSRGEISPVARKVDGRADFRGIHAPKPIAGRERRVGAAQLVEVEGLVVVRGATWKGLDFTGADLSSLRFIDTHIEDCVFDKAKCRDWRMWGTTVRRSSFASADLRGASLGAVQDGGRRNAFVDVTFTKTNLTATSYMSAEFVRCTFSNAKLDKVEFRGSTFEACVFQGELKEVLFDSAVDPALCKEATRLPRNQMLRADFSQARLRGVEFRGIDLKDVTFPSDDAHIVIPNYRDALDRALAIAKTSSDPKAKLMAGYLTIRRDWAGSVGVINRQDLVDFDGEEFAQAFLELVAPSLTGH